MARKEFGLIGVGSDVQYGKGGPRLTGSASTGFSATTDGITLANMNVASATLNNHAVNLGDLQAYSQGIDAKPSVRVISTGNITLSGTTVIDGVTLLVNDRVLVAGQTTTSQNGIYLVKASAWLRATDADATGDLTGGSFAFVEEGSVYADSGWVCSSNGSPVIGTDAIDFVQFSSAGIISVSVGLSKNGNTISSNIGASTITVNGNNDLIINSSATANQVLVSAGVVGNEPVWGALPIGNASSVSGVLKQVNGGLGSDVSAYAISSMIYMGSINTTSELAIGVNGNTMVVAGGVPTWGTLNLADGVNAVTGILSEANGGTNQSTYAQGDTLVATAVNTLGKLPLGTTGQMLQSDGTNVIWGAPLQASGTIAVARATILFSGGATQSIATIPSGAIVLDTRLNVTTSFTAGTSILIGDGTNTYMSVTENDPSGVALYNSARDMDLTTSSVVSATITGTPSVGSCTVTIQYIHP